MKGESMEVREAQPRYRAKEERVPPGYKRTEVGVIPEEWAVLRVEDIGSVVRGASPRPAGDPKYFGGDYVPWLTVGELTRIPANQLFVVDIGSALTEAGSRHSRFLGPDTLVIANSGATLGVAKILGLRACANDGIAAIVSQRRMDKVFVCHYINTQTERLRAIVAAGNGQPNLNTGRIRAIRLPTPPLPEQRAIARALSDVDDLISAMDKLIEKKRAIKQATMQQLLTGRTRLPGFSGEWEHTKLGHIGEFSKGQGIARSDVVAEGLPCVRYGELYTHYRNWTVDTVSHVTAEAARVSRPISKGDLLFAASGETAEEIGACVAYLGNETAYAGGDTVVLTPRDADSCYLGYLLNHQSIQAQKARMAQGDAVVHISARNLARLEIDLPPLPEQRAIAAILSDMDAEIDALERRREKTRLVKQGMMQELLTGRIRLLKPTKVEAGTG